MVNYIVRIGLHNFYFGFLFILFHLYPLRESRYLSTGNLCLDSLSEVRRHVLLEVKVGELIGLL